MDSKLSGRFKVTKILKKTNTKFFKDLKVGDIIYITYNIRQTILAGYAKNLTFQWMTIEKNVTNFFAQQLAEYFGIVLNLKNYKK